MKLPVCCRPLSERSFTSYAWAHSTSVYVLMNLRQSNTCSDDVCYIFWRAHRKVYPKVSGLAARSENCKWYSSLLLDAVLSLFYESVK
jgi:hypothetical protein